jgi:hypothetical protein
MAIWMKENLGLGLPGEGEAVVEGSRVSHAEEAGEVILMTAIVAVVEKLVSGLAGAVGAVVEGSRVCHAEEAGEVI